MKGQEEEGINWKYSQNTKKNSGQGQGQGGLVCLFVDVSGVVGTGGKRRMLKGEKGGREEGELDPSKIKEWMVYGVYTEHESMGDGGRRRGGGGGGAGRGTISISFFRV